MPKQTFAEILPLIIEYVRNAVLTDNKTAAQELVQNTRSLLLLLDQQKSDPYKLALAEEFIEETESIMQTKFTPDYDLNEIFDVLSTYVPIDKLTPQLVTFWLKRTCDTNQLKNMKLIVLFLNDQEKEKIYAKDESLREEDFFKKLLSVVDIC